jgi:hypothetical protein
MVVAYRRQPAVVEMHLFYPCRRRQIKIKKEYLQKK